MARQPNTPCSSCGKLLWPTANKKGAVMTCQPCRRAARKCGTLVAYKKGGCRCVECRAANARSIREYAARFKAEHGYSRWTEYKTPEGRGSWIGKRRRDSIYARDKFTCWICERPVDMALHWNDDLAASLDHVIPRSRGGDDTNENLRMAHRVCNSLRQAPEPA